MKLEKILVVFILFLSIIGLFSLQGSAKTTLKPLEYKMNPNYTYYKTTGIASKYGGKLVYRGKEHGYYVWNVYDKLKNGQYTKKGIEDDRHNPIEVANKKEYYVMSYVPGELPLITNKMYKGYTSKITRNGENGNETVSIKVLHANKTYKMRARTFKNVVVVKKVIQDKQYYFESISYIAKGFGEVKIKQRSSKNGKYYVVEYYSKIVKNKK